MGLTGTGKALLAVSAGIATLGLLWPYIEAYVAFGKPAGSACPLGYHGTSKAEQTAPNPRITVDEEDLWLDLWSGGTIWPGSGENTTVEALLVDTSRGVVLASGAAAHVQAFADKAVREAQIAGKVASVRQQDLGGAFLMPGFVDPHVHFLQAGLFLSSANLGATRTPSQFKQVLADHVRVLEAQEASSGTSDTEPLLWLQGGQWDEGRWPDHALPCAAWIDEATGLDRPALLSRADSHMAVANTAALRLAGITPDTPDPPGGTIDRGEDGHPTGILREAAIRLVAQHIPAPSAQQLQAALQAASDYALSRGVTTLNDLGRAPFTGDLGTTWQDLDTVIMPAADAGDLRVRLVAFTPLRSWQRMASLVQASGAGHPKGRLWFGGVKEFADGSLGARTALMWEPYTDDPGSHVPPGDVGSSAPPSGLGASVAYGTRVISGEELFRLAVGADAAGLTVAVHAIGDRGIDEVLDVFQRVREANAALHAAVTDPPTGTPAWVCCDGATCACRGPRHRIEHFQHISGPEAAVRAALLGVIPTPNPLHLVPDAELMVRRLGPERAGAGRSYAFRTLIEGGVRAGMATDWPVVDLDPLASVFTAAFRRDGTAAGRDDSTELGAGSEVVRVGQALLGHTQDAAHAALLDDYVGSLRPGWRADMVVLSSSPFHMQPGQPLPAVVRTYVDGQCACGCTGRGDAATAGTPAVAQAAAA